MISLKELLPVLFIVIGTSGQVMNKQQQMVRDIEMQVRSVRRLIGKSSLEWRVIKAMQEVPRSAFVPTESIEYAFRDGPLPIGYGQTISQPFMVALMTDLLEPEPDDVILEVGTGSGYQAAILSRLVQKVYTIEIVAPLFETAKESLLRLGYNNVENRMGDGYLGWPEHAPFDGIIVTAAAPYIPQPLVKQLRPGGKLVVPVGMPNFHQELMVVEKNQKGEINTRDILSVAFVPLTGDHEV